MFTILGFEYICNKFGINYSDLAGELNITKQNISAWVTGKREIPEKYLPMLEEKFKISKDFFRMYLTKVDELLIDRQKLTNESKHLAKENKRIIKDSDGQDHTIMNIIYPKDIQEQLNFINECIRIEKSVLRYRSIIEKYSVYNNNIEKGIEGSIIDIACDLIESPQLNKDKLHAVLTGFCLYYGLEEGLDARRLVSDTMLLLKKSEEKDYDDLVRQFSKEDITAQSTKHKDAVMNMLLEMYVDIKKSEGVDLSIKDDVGLDDDMQDKK